MIEAEEVQIVVVYQLVFFCLHDRICLCTKAKLVNNRTTRTRTPTSAQPATVRKPPAGPTPGTGCPGTTSAAVGLSQRTALSPVVTSGMGVAVSP